MFSLTGRKADLPFAADLSAVSSVLAEPLSSEPHASCHGQRPRKAVKEILLAGDANRLVAELTFATGMANGLTD